MDGSIDKKCTQPEREAKFVYFFACYAEANQPEKKATL